MDPFYLLTASLLLAPRRPQASLAAFCPDSTRRSHPNMAALKGIIAAFKKSRSRRDGHNTALSRGTAFLDQKRLVPTAIEKHYIGSMLYAFNFAEEAQRAEGGRPMKVLRRLADDLVS